MKQLKAVWTEEVKLPSGNIYREHWESDGIISERIFREIIKEGYE